MPQDDIDAFQAFSLLQGAHWFAEHLLAHGVHDAAATTRIQESCRNLRKPICNSADASDGGPRLFADFSDYRWTRQDTLPRPPE
ncbi:MAG: hypothetical protein HY815_29745 [Candidatus Riflebacteria bacterium]|nr:hypothetical protein [Candidatus Riflebacteria bacterium]